MVRHAAEWALRVVAILLIAVLLTRSSGAGAVERRVHATATSGKLDGALAAWTTSSRVTAGHVALTAVPPDSLLDWIAALGHAGVHMTWSGGGIAPIALRVDPVADPAGGYAVAVAAPRGALVTLRDSIGLLDSTVSRSAGAGVVVPAATGAITATVNATDAWTPLPARPRLGRILVEGTASWETKFAAAALQERGWSVDVVQHTAPGAQVSHGAPAPPDTARYAAVIVVDTAATMAAGRLRSYARAGGGVIVMHDALGLAPVGGGRATVLQGDSAGAIEASRMGGGRVVRVTYRDLWRRRMHGTGADPAAAERELLARIVSAAVTLPPRDVRAVERGTAAPLAHIVARLGSPSGKGRLPSPPKYHVPDAFILAAILIVLGVEWASRRLRGAR